MDTKDTLPKTARARAKIKETAKMTRKAAPLMSEPKSNALLLRLKAFEELLDKSPDEIIATMTPQMKDNVYAAVPRVIGWLSTIGSTTRAEQSVKGGTLIWRPCEEGEKSNGREHVWMVKFRNGAFELHQDGGRYMSPFKTATSAKEMAENMEWPFEF